jgi:hypothetical protein
MKSKKLNQKLFLSKRTVANLSSGEQGKVRGGWLATDCGTCVSWCDVCATKAIICGKTPYYTDYTGCGNSF